MQVTVTVSTHAMNLIEIIKVLVHHLATGTGVITFPKRGLVRVLLISLIFGMPAKIRFVR